MEVTLARKLLSYFVSFMLLYACKYSYDVHRPHIEIQSPHVSVQSHKALPSKTFSPEQPKPEALQSEEIPFLVIQNGKTLQSTPTSPTEDTVEEEANFSSRTKTNRPKEAQ
jgi:hypothetical protein